MVLFIGKNLQFNIHHNAGTVSTSILTTGHNIDFFITVDFLLIQSFIFYTANPSQGCGSAGAYPSCHWLKGRVHPELVDSQLQGNIERQKTIHSHTYT